MSDRFGDPEAEGAISSPPGPDPVPSAPFSWAVPPGGAAGDVFGAPGPATPGSGGPPFAPEPDAETGAGPPGTPLLRAPRRSVGPSKGWLPVAVVAALIGAGVGAGVTAIADHSTTSEPAITTIREGSAAPGPAVAGGANIPKLVASVLPAVVSIDVKTSIDEEEGTGMIISPDGLVVTNYHVVDYAAEDGGQITVTEAGSTNAIKAALIGTDPNDDVALLRINGAANLKVVTFGDSTKAVVGDAVVTIGNALGLSQGSPTVTSGIVSAVGRTVTASGTSNGTETLSDLIQTDAAINPGNSGGPLIDSAGQVIGMNTAVAGTTSEGTSAENIGFAIPSAEIESLLPGLEKGTTQVAQPGYMGVDVATLTPQLREEYGFTPTSGAVIISVVPGGPADQAGLIEADVIVAIGSTPVASVSDLQRAVQAARAGQTVKVTYYRGTEKQTASVTLVSASELQNLENQSSSFGLTPGGGITLP
jgi:S1-C subfamily serine protease